MTSPRSPRVVAHAGCDFENREPVQTAGHRQQHQFAVDDFGFAFDVVQVVDGGFAAASHVENPTIVFRDDPRVF